MTRISLADLEQGQRDHCIIVMEERPSDIGKVRDRSQESEARESPSKRAYSEESLVFETRLVDGEGDEKTVGAIGMVAEEAGKLTWKHFRNYMIRNGGIEKSFSRKSEVKVFYVDEEDDEIFVDTDDEYRELLKIAGAKSRAGETMVLKFVSLAKTRRGLGDRRRSGGERKVDVLGRELKSSPGKVMKHQSKFCDPVSGKVWKLNGGKSVLRGKVPGKMVAVLGPSKPVTIAEGLNEVRQLSRSLEEVKISPNRRLTQSPETTELLRQQASVFDWMTKNEMVEKQDAPPAWFVDYMENYKDEMTAEITAKVVHSLGIIMDNKLACLAERKQEVRVDESDFAKKVRKDKVKVKKVKTEAMRMTMELVEESKESKELKKLKKSLIKKTDKVVKVAMKIEKKNNQEQKVRKTSLSSSNTPEHLQVIKLSEKKEKKTSKTKEDKKANRTKEAKTKRPKCQSLTEGEEMPSDPASHPVSLMPGAFSSVVTSQPRSVAGLVEEVAARHLAVEERSTRHLAVEERSTRHLAVEERSTRHLAATAVTIELPRREGEGALASAVFLSQDNRLVQHARPGQMVTAQVSMVNMGCLPWDSATSLQRLLSSAGLSSSSSSLALPSLQPGQEGQVELQLTAPNSPGQYESVWHFWQGEHRFGPALKLKLDVLEEFACLPLTVCPSSPVAGGCGPASPQGTEMRDYCGSQGQEMRSIGISAESQEMVEIIRGRKEEKPVCTSEEGFDLLAAEVEVLALEDGEEEEEEEEEEDFEVIPVPDCFNLDVPFVLVEEEENNNTEEREEENEEEVEDDKEEVEEDTEEVEEDRKTPLEEALVAVRVVQDKLAKTQDSLPTKLKPDAAEEASLARLVELGFANRAENLKLLKQSDNNMETVLKKLFQNHGTSWAEKRH